jgi:hypothetical protein
MKDKNLDKIKQSNSTKIKLAIIASVVTLYAVYMGSVQMGIDFDKFIMLLLDKTL